MSDREELRYQLSTERNRVTAEMEGLRAELEQARVQLAGCLIAAEGHIAEPAVQGDYGWSPAYQAVLDLRREKEGLRATLKAIQICHGDHCMVDPCSCGAAEEQELRRAVLGEEE